MQVISVLFSASDKNARFLDVMGNEAAYIIQIPYSFPLIV